MISDLLSDLPDWSTKGEPYAARFDLWTVQNYLSPEYVRQMADWLRSRGPKTLSETFDYCSAMKYAHRAGWIEEGKRAGFGARSGYF